MLMASVKSRFFQPFEHMILRLRCAELVGKRPRIEEWPHARGNGALAVSILLSAQFGIHGGKHRMRDQLGTVPRAAGKGTFANIDAFGIAAKQVVRHAEPCCRETIGVIKTECTFQPRQ